MTVSNLCLISYAGRDQHWQHQDSWQRCAVWDCSHCIRHQVRERPQGEAPAARFSLFNSINAQLIVFYPVNEWTIAPLVLQVLAVNILGRFLLNSDRNIRSVPPSPRACLSFLSLPRPSLLLPVISLGRFYHFHTVQQTADWLQADREASRQAVISPSSLSAFPPETFLESYQKVAVCLLMLIS